MYLFSLDKLIITNYFTYRNDLPPKRETPLHGRKTILIHQSIVHRKIKVNLKIQSTSIKIKIDNYETIISLLYKLLSAIPSSNNLDLI